MNKSRLEAFSDGVIAIIITIIVLMIDIPEGDNWAALGKVLPLFFCYAVSFLLIGMRWTYYRRLNMMCKGTLKITPREGGGTVVKVTIPNTKQ